MQVGQDEHHQLKMSLQPLIEQLHGTLEELEGRASTGIIKATELEKSFRRTFFTRDAIGGEAGRSQSGSSAGVSGAYLQWDTFRGSKPSSTGAGFLSINYTNLHKETLLKKSDFAMFVVENMLWLERSFRRDDQFLLRYVKHNKALYYSVSSKDHLIS